MNCKKKEAEKNIMYLIIFKIKMSQKQIVYIKVNMENILLINIILKK